MSYRLTFSLASLILILGLVFASAPVLAHDVVPDDGHTHPEVIVDVALGDADEDASNGLQAVDLNKDSDNKDVKNQLKARVTFDIAVTIPAGATSPTLTPAAGSTPAFYATFTKAMLDATDAVTVAGYNPKTRLYLTTPKESSAALQGATAKWVVDPDNPRRYTRGVKITLDVDFEYDKTKTDLKATPLSDEEVAARDAAKAAAIAAGEVALEVTIKDGLLRSGTAVGSDKGQLNAQAPTTILVLPAPDKTAPMFLTAPTVADPADDGSVTVTLAFTEALAEPPTVTATALDAVNTEYTAGTDYTVEVTQPDTAVNTYEVIVSPGAVSAQRPMIPPLNVTLEVLAMDAAGNKLDTTAETDTTDPIVLVLAAQEYVDGENPEVVLVPLQGAQDKEFDITINATDNYSTDDLTVTVAITPATAVTEAALMAVKQDDGSYMVTVTPVPATEATPTIDSDTLTVTATATDAAGNTATDSKFYFLAARTYVDTTPPALSEDPTFSTPTDPGDPTEPTTVTFSFDELFTTPPTVTHTPSDDKLINTYEVSTATGVPETTGTGMKVFKVKVTPWPATKETGDIPAGSVKLTLSGNDAEGNAIRPGEVYKDVPLKPRPYVDTVPPTFTVTGLPTEPISGQTVVMLNFDEAVSDVTVTGNPIPDAAKYTFAVAQQGLTNTYSVTITPIPAAQLVAKEPPRIVTFTVKGTDDAMNAIGGTTQFTVILAAREAGPTTTPAPGDEGPPTALSAVVNANNTVTLTWTAPAGTLLGYNVSVQKVGDPSPTVSSANANVSSYTTGALTAGTYTIGVAARHASGTVASASIVVEIPGTPPPTGPAIILPAGIPVLGGIFTENETHGGPRVIGQTTLTGTILPHSFGVVLANSLPDLENFFRQRGTIVLTDTVSPSVELPAPPGTRAVVISEILWGLDAGEPAGMQDSRQFIELYNTGAAPVNVNNWQLVFTLHRPAPPIVVDRVSNAGTVVDPGWYMDVGQSGVLTGTTLAGATALGGTGVPVDIISAYRNIDYDAVEGGDLNKVPIGHQKGSWKATTRITTQVGIKASPGARHFVELGPLTKSGVSRSPFVINEIGNASGGANDWIELRNVTDTVQSLKNRQLSVVTANKNETGLFHFQDQDWKVPAKGVILIASTDPSTNDLAGGDNVAKANNLDEKLEGATHIYVVPTKGITRSSDGGSFNIPDSGKTLLILRNNHEAKHLGTGDQIADWIGTLSIQDASRGTNLWPLSVWDGPHGNVVKNGDEDFRAGKVYKRNNTNADGKEAIEIVQYTGVGYDRHAPVNAENGGTPGYANDAVKGDKSNWADQVSISEVMLVTDEGVGAARVPRATRLPQWVEIYNASFTEAVSLNGWQLEIQNDDTPEFLTNLHGTLKLPNVTIQPNQTVLVVSSSGLHSGHFPDQRTINVFTNSTYRQILGLTRRGEPMLNPAGFYIELRDHKQNPVDEIGNLGVSRRTGAARRDNFGEQWEMPALHSEDGHRTSMIRIYDNGVPRNGLNPVGGPKDTATSWVLASHTNFRNVPSLTYYGNHRDFGTPGYRGGGPLPVSLSKFRPERRDDGTVVIRWATESELNNAGFNILRSDAREGQFTKVNTQLIAGQGTTSERTTYEWKDTTAKPNVVYYYQIQDVSIDGHIQTLRVSRLKGNVTAAGKATTTWGELKALQ